MPIETPSHPTPFSQRPLIILGAGIIGCATARQLLQHGFSVHIIAEFLPGDQDISYASAWAGAAWHAAGGITPDQRYLQVITHRILLQMSRDPNSGVNIVDAREFLEKEPAPDSALWGRTVVSKVFTITTQLLLFFQFNIYIYTMYNADGQSSVPRDGPLRVSRRISLCMGISNSRDGPHSTHALPSPAG